MRRDRARQRDRRRRPDGGTRRIGLLEGGEELRMHAAIGARDDRYGRRALVDVFGHLALVAPRLLSDRGGELLTHLIGRAGARGRELAAVGLGVEHVALLADV